jgi:hypothetical protein
MGRRGGNAFKRNDGLRALKIAKDGGLEPTMIEVVVAKDGSATFRIYGDRAVPPAAGEPITREWTGRSWRAPRRAGYVTLSHG